MSKPLSLLRIALPVPLRRCFDYLPLAATDLACLLPGMRVKVPFQNRELIGIFLEVVTTSAIAKNKLKPILEILDTEPVIPADILEIGLWAADYYHFAVGEVLSHTLPSLLREGRPPAYDFTRKKTVREKKKAECFDLHTRWDVNATLNAEPNTATTNAAEYIASLRAKPQTSEPPLTLNPDQENALTAILAAQEKFQVFLLDGITGSGKTEVYLQAIAAVLKANQQVLVLVPEIGLTPQTIQRFEERFAVPIVALHSRLREKQRLNAWVAAKNGDAKIIIGTRSAIFSPMTNLGLIIVDEEHDLSFKQQEGFRYHARDLAIMRAHFKKIPIVLGSATPALETLQKTIRGQYQHLRLYQRAGVAVLPKFQVLDVRKISLDQGLAPQLITEIKNHLAADNQVMLFLNRRGYAPVLMCHSCGFLSVCKRCDARMTYHQNPTYLHCHHCDSRKKIPLACEQCHEKNFTTVGLGTERLEETLKLLFPEIAIARIDRDSTQGKGKMELALEKIHSGESRILIGTQMLAKGHHFPNVTLVGIIDADSGFFSSDFRGIERMGQLVLQVAGRAGRVEKPGTVVIQTHHPDHPLLYQLVNDSYHQFALSLLNEREQALLPPFHFLALFRAEAHSAQRALEFLGDIKKLTLTASSSIKLLGPILAPMPRRAGKHRAQLLLQTAQRPLLQHFLKTLVPQIDALPSKLRVKWSLDVDPLEMY